jgi:hypothetical protein
MDTPPGRISISGQVGRGVGIDGVREEKMPSMIAPEAIQSQERFVTGLDPKLAGTFEEAHLKNWMGQVANFE